MTAADDYLGEVRRSMAGMDRAVAEDILKELRSHIAEAAAANGGNMGPTLGQLGAPREVGRRYRELYGYGRRYRALFVAIAFILAIPSVPVLATTTEQGGFPFTYSILFLGAVAAWVLWVSVSAGSRAGLVAGLAGLAARTAGFAVAAATQTDASVTPDGVVLFLGTSVLLVVLGWIPGTARKVWAGPRPDL